MKKYFFEETQKRESRVTKFLTSRMASELIRMFNIPPPLVFCSEFNKKRYGRKGDVDLVLSKFTPLSEFTPENIEIIVGCQIKTSWYDESGKYKPENSTKHIKQLKLMTEESWDQIYLLDIVATKPSPSWLNSQTFDIMSSFSKEIGVPGCGHLLIIKHGIQGRDEEDAGSLPHQLLAEPLRRDLKQNYHDVRTGFCNFLTNLRLHPTETTLIVHDNLEEEKITIGELFI